MRKLPPNKQLGQGVGPRTLNGSLLDVRCGSLFLGWSEKRTRGLIERKLIPFKRLGGRIIFIKAELELWLSSLDGCSLDEARANLEARR